MRSYVNKDIFFKKMKKKPAVQNIIDNIETYSIDDIDKLQGSHFPLWIREELKSFKNRNKRSSEDVANDIAQQMILASTQNLTDTTDKK